MAHVGVNVDRLIISRLIFFCGLACALPMRDCKTTTAVQISQKHIWLVIVVGLSLNACSNQPSRENSRLEDDYAELRDSLMKEFSDNYHAFEMEVGSTARQLLLEAQRESLKTDGQDQEYAAVELDQSPAARRQRNTADEKPVAANEDDVPASSLSRGEDQQLIASRDSHGPIVEPVESSATLREAMEEANKVFVLAGDTEELIEDGVLLRRGKLAGNISPNRFALRDLRYFHSMRWQARKGKLLTVHPKESYRWIQENGEVELEVLDQEKFWSESRRLIVSLD